MQEEQSPVQDGNPYFLGDEALVSFSDVGNGVANYWLVNKKDYTIRPFETNESLTAVFGEETPEAIRNAVKVTTPKIDAEGDITEGVLSDFTILSPEYSIKNDGSAKALHFSPRQLKGRYGKPIDQKSENMASEVLEGLLNILKKNAGETGVPVDFINDIKEDDKLMAFYISALAYGEYTMEKIFSDIKHSFDNTK